MSTIDIINRQENRVSLVFTLIWVGTITAIVFLASYKLKWFLYAEGNLGKTLAIIACLMNMLFVGAMYLLDIKLLKTNGLLSYWKNWDLIKDEPPYATISICSTFFVAVIIIVIGADRTNSLQEFDLHVLQIVFAIAFFSILLILIQLNIFDGHNVLPLDPMNRRQGRRIAWYLYIFMLYGFAFSVLLLATLYSSFLGLFTNWIGALVLSTYYFSRLPIYCELTSDQDLLKAYDQLRSTHWPGKEPSQSAVVFTFKSEVVGGVRINFSKNSEQRLPLENENWDIRKMLENLSFHGKTLAQISQLIIKKGFRGRGVRRKIVRELWRIAKENDVDYAFIVAPESPGKLYRRLGFKKIPIEYPFKSEHDGANLDLFMLSITDTQT